MLGCKDRYYIALGTQFQHAHGRHAIRKSHCIVGLFWRGGGFQRRLTCMPLCMQDSIVTTEIHPHNRYWFRSWECARQTRFETSQWRVFICPLPHNWLPSLSSSSWMTAPPVCCRRMHHFSWSWLAAQNVEKTMPQQPRIRDYLCEETFLLPRDPASWISARPFAYWTNISMVADS